MTGSDSAVTLEGVGKRYVQTSRDDKTVLHRLARLGRSPKRELWALKDISLEVAQGETMGIIGRNGSGKTTMLRMLSGVSAPTTGRLRVVGRVAPLIGIGVGFNNELTGRENVFANGRLLGMSEAKLRRDFDSIAAFSEIESFLDTPVKFYSSGMFLRLAFSVAIHTDPEVLLLDEILAVGDIAFQAKCMDKMREIQAAGTTIVIVTHNLHTLDRIAPRAVLLSHGELVYDGPTEQAIGRMHEVMQRESLGRQDSLQQGERGFVGNVDVQVDLVDGDGVRQRTFTSGDEILLRVTASFEEDVAGPRLGVLVAPLGLGTPAYSVGVPPSGYSGQHGPGRPMEAEIRLDNRLLAGGYSVHVALHEERGAHTLGMSTGEVFYVTSNNVRGNGFVNLDARISVNGEDLDLRPAARLDGPAQAS
ncbi:MAG TPA: ABC transporter ATP-binding protein [Mycobacteriales bacterium]|nr:ABC transporter ATP-binding protein [Mycobacteriales bacterium]